MTGVNPSSDQAYDSVGVNCGNGEFEVFVTLPGCGAVGTVKRYHGNPRDYFHCTKCGATKIIESPRAREFFFPRLVFLETYDPLGWTDRPW